MKNKKVLFCSEASWLTTGYSVYTGEVLSRLNQVDGLEVAELACYAGPNDPHLESVPWKVYPNKPDPSHPQLALYNNSPSSQFGEFSFNQVLLDFQPDIVMDIRDWWMMEYQQRSPFRDFFHWAIMPTVDAEPQDVQWINTYSSADAVFAYSEFGRDTMLSQSDNLKFIDLAPPAASNSFFPVLDKAQHKLKMGIDPETMIVGTVMRNQRRKLYPDLFESFREFLDRTQDPNVFLYCHTYYPDIGWDLPTLMDKFNIANRVLFTYKCKQCGEISPDFFQDAVQLCPSCGTMTKQLTGIANSISEQELSKIYNLFDIYVQYANSEGFGMPQLEAAYCGLPLISTYYSAMQSVVDNLGAVGIKPLAYSVECETGCKRAIPDNAAFVDSLVEMHENKDKLPQLGNNINQRARDTYTWDKTADVWLSHINSVEPKDPRQTWFSPPKIFQPAQQLPQGGSMIDKVNFIFTNMLHKPEWLGGYLWKRVLRDCTFGYRCENLNKDFYFSESHVQSYTSNQPFSINEAAQEMIHFRNQINQWEQQRSQMIGGTSQ